MKILRCLPLMLVLCLFNTLFAQANVSGFMMSRDLLGDSESSNINLHNNRSSNVTAFGLYVRQYAYVLPGESCASATTIFPTNINIAAGAVVSPTVIPAGKSVSVGSNYLYNMILQAIFYASILNPPVCALPGCTWGSDFTLCHWCIYLGALAPTSNASNYISNVPPSTVAVSGSGYDYNLISNYVYLGPISCNDSTQTCTVANPQTQSFS